MKTINTFKISLSILLLLALPSITQALDYIYTTNNGAVTITDYVGPDGDVTIPSTMNGLPVTAIDRAFYNCKGLTGVTIPKSITSIEDIEFYGCSSLTNINVVADNPAYMSKGGVLFDKTQTVLKKYPGGKTGSYTIPSNVTNIGHRAFQGCQGLTGAMTIPSNVTFIGDYAFTDCNGLTGVMTIPDGVTFIGTQSFGLCNGLTGEIIIPASVSFIGSAAFSDCSGVTAINVAAENSSYKSDGGVLFNKNKTTLMQYPGGKIGNYTIPSNVTAFGTFAFYGCSGLTGGITLPDGITSIGQSMFYNCSSLTRVMLPSSVTSIESSAFADCSGLMSMTIPPSVTSIGYRAFAGCTNLNSICFRGDCPELDSTAFNGIEASIYYLPRTTGWGASFGDRQTVQWDPKITADDASFGIQTNEFSFNIEGAVNLPIVVKACTSLSSPAWQPLQTNVLANGSLSFRDSQWTNYPCRFYSIEMPE